MDGECGVVRAKPAKTIHVSAIGEQRRAVTAAALQNLSESACFAKGHGLYEGKGTIDMWCIAQIEAATIPLRRGVRVGYWSARSSNQKARTVATEWVDKRPGIDSSDAICSN